MLHFLIFSLIFVQLTQADISCPNGFKSLNNKKCIQILTNSSTHADAVATCTSLSGHLVSISNAIDNNAIAQLGAAGASPIWIGLKCASTNQPASCSWDDGQGSSQAYNNFASGNPYVEIGSCVYMMVTGNLAGKWLSGNSELKMNFVCETSAVDPVQDRCDFQYNGFCYHPIQSELTQSEAEYTCEQQYCQGSLVSIHSAAENQYIRNLFTNNAPAYIRIGAKFSANNNQFSWLDNTAWNYDNIGYSNQNLGSCLSMALRDDIVAAGQWMSSRCETQLSFVCKRPIGANCGATVSPTTAPGQCAGRQVLDNSGTIYSPSYPSSYVTQTGACIYLLDTPIGTNVQIQFPVLNLDPQGSISLYNQLEDTKPFLVLEGSYSSNQWFNSTSNTIKMIFRSCLTNCDLSKTYNWMANFQPSNPNVSPTMPVVTVTPNINNPSGCNSTILSAPGSISSPNYPNNYPNNIQCMYHLSTQGGYRIRIDFKSFMTEQCCDIVVVHDGPYLESPEIGRISGSQADDSQILQSTSNSMLVTFTTDSNNSARGFLAYFASF